MKKSQFALVIIVAMGAGLVLTELSYSATYYVRPDGGTATQCTGLTDAAYPGSGTGKACAFSHPFFAIAPIGNNPTKMVGGDTLIIEGSNNAQYRMGFGAPNTLDASKCAAAWPYDCYMRSVPSGPDPTHPTRILGKGWNTGCANPPQLWATERAERVLNLVGSNNVELQCLEITDHSACQQRGPNACKESGSPPFGAWGQNGLKASDSTNVVLKNINIHGMAYRGVHAGRLKDWTLEDTKIVANPFVGWEGDIGSNSSNSGTMMFNRVSILYNGCGETYPDKKPYNCYSQDQSGYGDGIGTYFTGGNWVFSNSEISHNASDGLDLLYHDSTGSITIKRSRFEGNAGNQVKTSGNTAITDTIMIGNCAYFATNPITWKTSTFNNCRSGGTPLAVHLHPGTIASIYNSTITSNGDTMILTTGASCNGSEKFISRNNVFLGGTEFLDGSDKSALYYASGAGGNGDGPCGKVLFDNDYSVVWNTKNFATDCAGKPNVICQEPKFLEPIVQYYKGDAFNAGLQADSPARNKGAVLTGISSLDFNSFDRGSSWDIGALEFGSTGGSTPVTTVLTPSPGPASSPIQSTGNTTTPATPPANSQNSNQTQTQNKPPASGSTTTTTTPTQPASSSGSTQQPIPGSGSSSSSSSGSNSSSGSGSSSSQPSSPGSSSKPAGSGGSSLASSGSGGSSSGGSSLSSSSGNSNSGNSNSASTPTTQVTAPVSTTTTTTTTTTTSSSSNFSQSSGSKPSTSTQTTQSSSANKPSDTAATSNKIPGVRPVAQKPPLNQRTLADQASKISPPPKQLPPSLAGKPQGTALEGIVSQMQEDVSSGTVTPPARTSAPTSTSVTQLAKGHRDEAAEVQNIRKRKSDAKSEAQSESSDPEARGKPTILSMTTPFDEMGKPGAVDEGKSEDQIAEKGKESKLEVVKKWVDGVVGRLKAFMFPKK